MLGSARLSRKTEATTYLTVTCNGICISKAEEEGWMEELMVYFLKGYRTLSVVTEIHMNQAARLGVQHVPCLYRKQKSSQIWLILMENI